MSGPAQPLTLFSLAQRGLSARPGRRTGATATLANAASVAAREQGAYKPLRAVFATALDQASGLATVDVRAVQPSQAKAIRTHDPDHPMADANGDVWTAPVDENAEMVEMLDSSRQYQNLVEALSTAKQLMLETMRMK